jgi:hypothetical protein
MDVHASAWYAANIELWYNDIAAHTFATQFLPLHHHEALALVQLFNHMHGHGHAHHNNHDSSSPTPTVASAPSVTTISDASSIDIKSNSVIAGIISRIDKAIATIGTLGSSGNGSNSNSSGAFVKLSCRSPKVVTISSSYNYVCYMLYVI